MKTFCTKSRMGFTRVEMMVVICVIGMLVFMLLPGTHSGNPRSPRIYCMNNLKIIAVAYRLWEGDNGGLYPSQQKVANNGWSDFLANADQGSKCWMNYACLSNDLGNAPKLLVCPADERQPARSFSSNFDNRNVSYFVGVSANGNLPQSILAGDRNLGPGVNPDPDYGYSPKNGRGNDVAVPVSGPVSWSLKMHSLKSPSGASNILLGDGAGQEVSSISFEENWLRHANRTTNWPAGHTPALPSIRLVFP